MSTLTSASRHNSFGHAAYVAIEHAVVSLRKHVADFFHYLAQSAEARQRARDEAYLAEALDCYDLEYRMRELDRARNSPSHWMN